MTTPGQDELTEIAQQLKAELDSGTTPAGRPVSVRELLGWFGHKRRGTWIVSRIRDVLSDLDLRAVPDFEQEYIDGSVSIQLDMDAPGVRREPEDPTVRIGALAEAHKQLTSARPNDPLLKATTTMLINDFSQLPVMVNERDVKGMITWRSIGQAFVLARNTTEVRHCMDEHREIAVDAPLFDALSDIEEHGYVLVRDRDRDNRISGIVTASDFASQFAERARPFLIVGEIELHLRKLVGRFTLEEIVGAADDGNRPVSGTADLNFGAYCRLLEEPDRWDRLQLGVDRATFMAHLDKVRQIRNDVMHFTPDGIAQEDVAELERVAPFLRRVTAA